jgi:hypothetical protein
MELRSLAPASLVFLSLALVACGDDTSGTGGGGGGSTSGPGAGGDGNGSTTSSSSSSADGGGGSGAGGTGGSGAAGTGGSGSGGEGTGGSAADQFWPESLTLCELVNAYRVEEGLPPIPISVALMTVAETHVRDLNDHPGTVSGNCNMHSWSDGMPQLYSGCCYTPDHAQAACMWAKPGEITAGWGANAYDGNGFEISASTSNPASALQLWKGSSGHNAVILNEGGWANFAPWPAMGCGAQGGYAHVWFGEDADPQTL